MFARAAPRIGSEFSLCNSSHVELHPALLPALFQLIALGQEGPASPEDTATLDSVVALYFANSGSRASQSPAGFATVVPVAVPPYFTSTRGTFPVCSGPATPRQESLPEIEVHRQFVRKSTVELVHAGPASPPRLSLPEVASPFSSAPPSGHAEMPSTPFETTLVSGVSFPLLVPASTRLLARYDKVSPCVALWRCSWDGRSDTMASSNSHTAQIIPPIHPTRDHARLSCREAGKSMPTNTLWKTLPEMLAQSCVTQGVSTQTSLAKYSVRNL